MKTSALSSRFAGLAPTLLVGALIALAGCATQPPGQPAPIRGERGPQVERAPVDPQPRITTQAPVQPDVTGPLVSDFAMGLIQDAIAERNRPRAFTPDYMSDRRVVRAGVLLPFSHPSRDVQEEAEGMLAAIEMALFDNFGDNVLLLPKDTSGSRSTAQSMAEEAYNEGAAFILGPLFASNVKSVKETGVPRRIPVIAFSNDRTAAGSGTWLASITPEEEVAEVVRYAIGRGYTSFAFFGPDSDVGQRAEAALKAEADRFGSRIVGSAFYPDGSGMPDSEARIVSGSINAAASSGERVAVLIPERGARVKRIAPLLTYSGVDSRRVRFMGLSGWNDPGIWSESSLEGSWYAAPSPGDIEVFEERFERLYSQTPSSLSSVAYDAAAMAIELASDGDIDAREITDEDGFRGVNGLFRFRQDGTTERRLAIFEINQWDNVSVVREAGNAFEPGVG